MTKTPQHNVPELRFPEFEGEWEKKKLDNVGNIFTGNTPDTSKSELYEGKYPLVSPVDIHNNRYVKCTNKTVSKKGFYGGKVIRKGASLFVCIGSTIGKVGQAGIDVTTNQQINALIPYENYDDNFMYSALFKYSNKIKKLAATQAVPIINKKTFSSISIYIPIFKEQQKIGMFFSKLDRQIELEEKKLELLEQQKKGYMQKIFSQELRFKDENGKEYPEWEEKKLGEETSITMGQSPKSQNYTSDEQNTVLIQGNADLNNGEIYPRIYTTQITKMAEIKDIILSVRAPVGEIAIAQIEACIGRGVCAIKGSKFIYIYLEYLKQINYWKKITQGSTFESISSNDIKNSIFYKPDEKEQAKIANFLSEIDKLIKDQLFKLEYLKQRKQALLQKMFV